MENAREEEKEAAVLLYTTAFIRMMREGGCLYKRILDNKGVSVIVMSVDGKEYCCQESLILYYTEDTLNIVAYEDQSMQLREFGRLSSHEILDYMDMVQGAEGKRKISIPDVELPQIEIEKPVPFEELPEAPELTLNEEQQAEFIMDETERYKIGASLNFIISLACIVLGVVVALWG